MKKEDKALVIEKLSALLQKYPHFYLVDSTGLNSEDTTAVRRICFKNEVKMVTVKNNLMKKAMENLGIDYTPLNEALKGTTSVLFTEKANVPGRMIKDDAKFVLKSFKGAFAEGGYYDASQLAELAALKSKEELIADVVALLQSPIKNVVSALQSGGNNIHGVLKTLAERPE